MPIENGKTAGELKKREYPKSLLRRAKIIGVMLASNDRLQSNSPELWVGSYLSELGGAKI